MEEQKLVGEELAKHWDRYIVNAWFKFPNARCGRVISLFLDEYRGRVDRKEFYALNRVPPYFLNNADFRFWINRTMFPIWEKLIEIQEEDVFERVEVLKLLKRWESCCKKCPNSTPYDNELRTQNRKIKQNNGSRSIRKKAVDELYASHRRNNQWNVCK